jgi:hypothetical protein
MLRFKLKKSKEKTACLVSIEVMKEEDKLYFIIDGGKYYLFSRHE